ncbi:type II toxin-antitoxin system VapC family toxin [Halomonas ramblicola]|uniref:type II toxin-antitoxin system VapC family toxin n=1 Tax=Halomonas ramblicola TaxID=747349 RepID=UPI0025B4B7D3|nr:type II toxin-antitoxin system VapC family toxin [Halomonas ramblicola]MDN3523311.1 type II toxin-antitoxin system VapC family toxin [Halomonas ramblicola]
MIVLDTNVLSELMRPVPEPRVVDWLDTQETASVAITAITVAEVLYGIERLPDGRRKRSLAAAAAAMFDEDFAGRILAFDGEAAIHYAERVAASEQAGRAVQMADAQIAAICLRHQATLASRNVKDFAGCGVPLINPWDPG